MPKKQVGKPMYIVLVVNKNKDVFSDLIPQLKERFPTETFSISGSEAQGYQLRLEGTGDELAPRSFAKKFVKTWKPPPTADKAT